MRAAIYVRLSKLRKGETVSTGLERQEQDCRGIVGGRGWDVAAVFKDVASASPTARKARKAWLDLEAAIEAGEFDAVVFWLEDRSNRNVLDAARFVEVCQQANVRVVIAGTETEYDFSDSEHIAKFYGEASQAQREVARIEKRIRRQQLELAENGQDHGGGKRAFGFTGSGMQKVPLARALAEQDMIREATSRVIAGDTLRGICLDWTKRGVAGTQGHLWSTRTLKRILCSPRVAGLREHNGTLHPATWSPIVPRAEWEAVKAILEDPARRTNDRGGVHRYLLTGLIFCGVCGNRLSGVRKDKDGYIGYMCRNKYGEVRNVYSEARRRFRN
jgi:DNA invertase Pin-like site-specific DNA recombinase